MNQDLEVKLREEKGICKYKLKKPPKFPHLNLHITCYKCLGKKEDAEKNKCTWYFPVLSIFQLIKHKIRHNFYKL